MVATAASTAPSRTHEPVRAPGPRRRRGPARRGEGVAGYVFLSPWLLGLFGITAIPTLYSLYLSFSNYDILSPTFQLTGWANYRRMLHDPQFLHAVRVTVTFAVTAVPLKLAAALGVALLLKRQRRGVGVIRGLFYLPSLVGGSVALALVWQALFSADGAVNRLLALVGLHGRPWVNDPDTALGTLVLLVVWEFGAPMVIFLAGLKQVPQELYEAAAMDGAGRWRTFWSVTWPMLSPVVFFNLVLETIKGFQSFTPAFVISGGTPDHGGPVDSTLLYSIYLYNKGFADYQMGYASALAWVFLLTVGLLTAVLFTTGRFWVHYADRGD